MLRVLVRVQDVLVLQLIILSASYSKELYGFLTMDVPPIAPKVKSKPSSNVALQNKVSKFLQNNLESDKVSRSWKSFYKIV